MNNDKKKLLIRIGIAAISLILVAVLVFTLISSCRQDDTADSDNVSSEYNGEDYEGELDDEDYSDGEEDEDYQDDEDWDDEDWDDEDWADEDWADEDWDDEDWDDEDQDDEDQDDEDQDDEDQDDEDSEVEPVNDYYTENLEIYNGQAPVMTNYRGVSASVWHAYGFMKDDKTGRAYTDEMMDLELSRLYDAGVRYCRTRFNSSWIWDTSITNSKGYQGAFNWDSARANYFYEYANALDKQDTSILLAVGWHFQAFVKPQSASIAEVSYLMGNKEPVSGDAVPDPGWVDRFTDLPELYNETAGYEEELAQLDNTWRNYAIAGLRYGEFYAQALEAFKARGIDNISHFIYFTEPSYRDPGAPPEGFYPEEYIFAVDYIQDKLRERGVYNMVKHMGPNQGSVRDGDGLLRYILEKKGRSDMFDTWSAHFYPSSKDPTNDVYHDIVTETFTSYLQPLKDVNIFGLKTEEFWVDEFYCRSDGMALGVDSPWAGLQNCVSFINAQQLGINNISLWQIFDQLWTDQTNTGGQFENGIHTCGSAPSLFQTSIPHGQYYATSLFAKYNGSKNGTVYRTSNGTSVGVYIGFTKLESGDYTMTVVNANTQPVNIEVDMEEAINKTLYRHLENVATLVPTTAAHIAGVDKTFVTVGDRLCDTLPGNSVAVYTSLKF